MDYVLAMYDVRGKQNFIYSGKKIKEIIGASHVIKDVFNDYLYDAAKEYCENEHIRTFDNEEPIYNYQNVHRDKNRNIITEEFTVSIFEEHMKLGQTEDEWQYRDYIGEVVYEGGGNFFVLYCNAETCEGVNRIFTAKLLKEIGTLKVLCTYKSDLNFSYFEGDRKDLYVEHRLNEAQESVIFPVNTLPFVQTAPESNRPYTNTIDKTVKEGSKIKKTKQKVTTEQKTKYKKYDEYIKEFKNKNTDEDEYDYDKEEFLLDYLVEERGTESLLAVIYIDGNSMGAKVQACLDGKTTYDECVNELRSFSKKIQTNRVDKRTRAINKRLEEKYNYKKEKIRRTIVAAGDEMTIICNARDALDVVEAYFEGLPEDESACAGIAIFHSHSPYSDAYRIAEECCESCKSYMKRAGINDLNLMDFHYCQGGIGISLDKIREREFGDREEEERLFSRPWRICMEDDKMRLSPVYNNDEMLEGDYKKGGLYYDLVNLFAKEMSGIARSNVRTLRDASQQSTWEMEMELKRINAHGKEPVFQEIDKDKDKKHLPLSCKRSLIYDLTMVYDLWFVKGETK